MLDQWDYNDYEDDPAYIAYCEEEEAIQTGTAIELRPCYLCYLEATGKPDLTGKLGPLRGVLDHGTTPGPDPYDVAYMSCGHALI